MSLLLVNSTNLLPYEPSTDPNPLRISTPEETEVAAVNINVGGGITTPAWCNKITVRVPVGAGAEHLTSNGAGIKTGASTGWTPSAPAVSGGFAVITFTPARAVQFTGQLVTLTLSGIEVNRTAGQVRIEIVESSSPTNSGFTDKNAAVEVDKFPAGFVFRNFAPEKIMVENGEAAVLHWEGSDAKYTMHWAGSDSGVPVDKERSWTTPRGLTTVTGFMLRAEVTAGGTTLHHTLTTAVTVRIPDLVVRTLTVQGDASFEGLGTFKKTLQVTGSGSLVSDGNVELRKQVKVTSAGSVTVDGASTFNNNVTVAGQETTTLTVKGSLRGQGTNPLRVSQPAGLKVDAALAVHGATTTHGAVTANGAAAFNNDVTVAAGKTLRAAGPVKFEGPAQMIGTAHYRRSWRTTTVPMFSTWFHATAPTDGILTAAVTGLASSEVASWLTVFADGHYYRCSAPAPTGAGSLALPLRKGQPFYAYVEANNDMWRLFMTLSLYWYPIGQTVDLQVHSKNAPEAVEETSDEFLGEPVPQEYIPPVLPETP
ncbi:hypothetical protein [Yinghuangia seranimata]|uniref:hypothetical protein n=1 Tax=Yinghuangia seranimata TaxID=408067 RepID=UPI00248B21B7|nr:hypothetical protein [Yinghuangia seranimata]MDI2130037.1 hypothetical protein [Yinghuangia seranimata]